VVSRDVSSDPCNDCGYCMPCPNGVDIATNMRLWRVMRREGVTAALRSEYADLRAMVPQWRPGFSRAAGDSPAGTHAGACRDCGECEARCPEGVRVIRRLQDLAAALSG